VVPLRLAQHLDNLPDRGRDGRAVELGVLVRVQLEQREQVDGVRDQLAGRPGMRLARDRQVVIVEFPGDNVTSSCQAAGKLCLYLSARDQVKDALKAPATRSSTGPPPLASAPRSGARSGAVAWPLNGVMHRVAALRRHYVKQTVNLITV
jgi:hypothetical protein